jgi:cytochrome bd ubiquinol oxidase subunit II
MQTLWFILVAFMLTTYVLLDGFDLGAGAIHLIVARTDDERRTILRAIGPVWDGNEVWLIAAAGTLFFVFPVLYASSFSGFYLPLMIVLWLLILRGVAVELRGHLANPVWAGFWDGAFFLGSALLAFFFGAAAGNVVRGVPLGAHGLFFEALWTDLNPFDARPGILDWYTILIGLLALAALAMHGANYIAVKTDGPLQQRARRIARLAWIATIALTVLGTLATFWVQPAVLKGFGARPWGVIFPLLALAGLAGVEYFRRQGRDLHALLASGAYLAGMMWSSLVALYPMVLPARNPANSLTISNASGSQYGQTVGLVWWLIGMALAAVYFIFVYRLFWGKVSATPGEGY